MTLVCSSTLTCSSRRKEFWETDWSSLVWLLCCMCPEDCLSRGFLLSIVGDRVWDTNVQSVFKRQHFSFIYILWRNARLCFDGWRILSSTLRNRRCVHLWNRCIHHSSIQLIEKGHSVLCVCWQKKILFFCCFLTNMSSSASCAGTGFNDMNGDVIGRMFKTLLSDESKTHAANSILRVSKSILQVVQISRPRISLSMNSFEQACLHILL